MKFLLSFHLLALAVVIGSSAFFALVGVPAAFASLPTRDQAGSLNAVELGRLSAALIAGFLLLFVTGGLLGRRLAAGRWIRLLLPRLALVGFSAALVTRALILPIMADLRRRMPGLLDTVPWADPLLVRFQRLHGLSVSLLAVEILAGCAILVATAALLASGAEGPGGRGAEERKT